MANWWDDLEHREDAKRIPMNTQLKNPAPRSLWQIFRDSVSETFSTMGSGFNGAILRSGERDREEQLARDWAASHNQKPAEAEKVIQQNRKRQADEVREKREQSRVYREDDERRQKNQSAPAKVLRTGAEIAGEIVGDVNPTYAIPLVGATAKARIAGQAAVAGISDAAIQGQEIHEGIRDEFSMPEVITSTAAGAAFQTAGEGVAKGARAIGEHISSRRAAASEDFLMPVQGRITSEFGHRKAPKAGASTNHQGVDIAARVGTPIMAPADGVVKNVGRGDAKRGNWVEIEHPDGSTSRYLHMSGFKVKPGDNVSRGQIFGRVGATGNVTGPHLHWSVLKNGKPVDPRSASFSKRAEAPAENGVPPMDPRELSRIMDDPEASGQALPDGEPEEILQMADEDLANLPEQTENTKLFPDNSWLELQASHEMSFENAARQDLLEHYPGASDELLTDMRSLEREHPLFTSGWHDNIDSLLDKHGYNVQKMPQRLDGGKPVFDEDGTPTDEFLTALGGQDVLTPMERTEMDATGEYVPMDSSHEKFTGYPAENAPANDPTRMDSVKGFIKSLMQDERGSLGYRDEPEAAPEHPASVRKLIEAVKSAEPVRVSQDRLYSKERGERVSAAAQTGQYTSGEAGFHAELSKLGGEMPKKQFESIRQNFQQPEIDELFDIVKNHPRLTFFEKVHARIALSKLLAAEGASVPTKSEIKLLNEVFPEDLTEGLLRSPFRGKLGEHVANALNVPRSIMSSMDFSAPGRQGIFLVGSKAYWTSFADMFRAYGSEKAYQALNDSIAARPTYKLMRDAGLALSNTGKKLSEREEAFMSQWAEKIPVAGKLIRASDRAYSGYLNKLRADTFDSLVRDMKLAGVDFEENPKAARDAARFVNAATGRGDLGKLNQAAPLLAGFFFSPRLMASRISLLNPKTYIDPRIDPTVRKMALKSLIGFSGAALTTLSLAKAAGLSVDIDPRSSDFAKIKVGNTRYDILGGFQQYIRAGAQLITGEKVNGNTGKVTELGKGYKADTRLDVVEKFFENKASPLASFVMDLLRGKDAVGKDLDAKSMVAQRFTPLIAQDMYDLYEDQGAGGVAIGLTPAMFGVGVQTYQPREKETSDDWWKSDTDDQWWKDIENKDSF